MSEATPEDVRKFDSFKDCMLAKYVHGREEHGTKVIINPLEEAQKECIDLANYALMQYYRLEKLKEKVDGLEHQIDKA